MNKLLKFLQGKKGAIATIIGGIIAYLATKGIIGEAEVILFGIIQVAIFGKASQLTKKMYDK